MAARDRERDVTIAEAKDEYHSGKTLTAFRSKERSLGLAAEETPAFPWEPLSAWKNVMDFGPVKLDAATRKPTDKLWERPISGSDITSALQKAIDSGATTAYLPHGMYLIRETIHLRGKLRVLQGCGSILIGDKAALGDRPMFRADGPGSEPIFIDRVSTPGTDGAGQLWVMEHAGPRPLVILHSRWVNYRNAPGCGKLFADDVCGGPWLFTHPQQAWLRSLNVESDETKVHNLAATLWVLGFKSEGSGTDFDTGKGSATEILGGTLYEGFDANRPCFVVDGGRLSATITIFWSRPTVLKETRAGETKTATTGKGQRRIDLVVADP